MAKLFIAALLLTLALMLPFAGCSSEDNTGSDIKPPAQQPHDDGATGSGSHY